MVRQCHSNTCPVGVCTQDEKLREKFSGTPDKIVNLFTFIAEEVREILASLGFKSLNEIIGRTDLLRQVSKGSESLDDLDLNPLFVQADPGENKRYCEKKIINKVPDTLDEQIYKDVKEKFNNEEKIHQSYDIKNTHRAVGTRLSHYIYKKFNKKKLPEDFISIDLFGSAGQSFGAFGIEGLKLRLFGDANDYVGKGLSGAKLVIHPPKESNLKSEENTIIGNTVLYGATSGKLFASGQAGERFAVRNSGALSVIEGCDSNGCEYMTGGVVVILGKVGDNFAAGMTGGMAFIYDLSSDFEKYVNPESVIWQKIETRYWINYLKSLIEEHYKETNSQLSKKIINNFDKEILNFVQVCPKEMINKLANPLTTNPIVREVS
jgi:glutamate synthase (NADPH/NADH) large chain